MTKVTPQRLLDNDGKPYSTLYEAHIDLGVCMIWAPQGNVEQERYAHLIADALNAHATTGLSPSELAAHGRTLREFIAADLAGLRERSIGSTHWDGCEAAHPRCDLMRRMEAVLAATEAKGEAT